MEKELVHKNLKDVRNDYLTPMERDKELYDIFKDTYALAEPINFALEAVRGTADEEYVRKIYRKLKVETDVRHRQSLKSSLSQYDLTEHEKVTVCRQAFTYHCEKAGNPVGVMEGKYYVFTGKYWKEIDEKQLKTVFSIYATLCELGKVFSKTLRCKKMFIEDFYESCSIPPPKKEYGKQIINLRNVTLHITKGEIVPKPHDPNDRCKYVLNYDYDPEATAPIFQSHMERTFNDKETIMAYLECIGYIFCRDLNMEVCIIFLGAAGTGKSTSFHIINELVGKENITHQTLDSLCNRDGHAIARVAGALLNYCSEISGKNIDSYDLMKQLCSKEPMQARSLYKDWITVYDIPTLFFNANEMPPNLEASRALFRRLQFIPFDNVVPPDVKKLDFVEEIKKNEMSGVLNLAIEGMKRLITNQKFTESTAIKNRLEEVKRETNSVAMFMYDNGYLQYPVDGKPLVKERIDDLFRSYIMYCENTNIKAAH